MKRIILVAALCVITGLTQAQIWIFGGLNSSTTRYHYNDSKVPTSSKIGMLTGVLTKRPLIKKDNNTFSIDPGIFYIGKGQDKASATRLRVHYVQMGIPATFHAGNRDAGSFFAGIGPFAALAVGGHYQPLNAADKMNLSIGNDKTDIIKYTDFGITINAGANIKSLRIQLQYDLGLTNVYPGVSNTVIKNRTVSFLLGYKLF